MNDQPPPTPTQKTTIVDALHEALRPIVVVWDRQAANTLEVVAQNARTEAAVNEAVRWVKIGVAVLIGVVLGGGAMLGLVLEDERILRRDDRLIETGRRDAARAAVLQAIRLYGQKLDALPAPAPCPVTPKQGRRR